MIRGLDHFRRHFKGYSHDFVLVGGVAGFLLLDEVGAPRVRPTKDLDIVLFLKPSPAFLNELKLYIKSGGYEIQSGEDGHAIFYRFQKPQGIEYPEMIELFASSDTDIELFEGQRIIPLSDASGVESLSAILVDEDYYSLIQKNVTEKDGLPILGSFALIPFKAKAYLDIKARKEDSKNWKKHRGDIINLAVSLIVEGQKSKLEGKLRQDFIDFLDHLKAELTDDIIKGACKQKFSKDEVISLLEKTFL